MTEIENLKQEIEKLKIKNEELEFKDKSNRAVIDNNIKVINDLVSQGAKINTKEPTLEDKRNINNKAKNDLVNSVGLDNEMARKVIISIVQGKISNVFIRY